ncbi:DUF2316 family protein [Secundilactobacillus silagei]|uniref:DUF2316 family protein n=1 Tax=Secundilactobacillus silagei JCM 19001 TaxID=1302250 RepID=A0A1Z5IIS2_9LACO|nr:DUF2316 family protein [Secundilactobacillus silagei]TDG72887.1 hypothetical protein C5L25_002176 [Secundilactobacillus silagei JCM 19001]GAX01589.1 hypothetical protein IWT126_01631 [Secundilactobacillus silagei JCM 19001]
MSLTPEQTEASRQEFKENIKRSGLSLTEIATALGTTADVIAQCVDMHPRRIDDNWIIRNYLLQYMGDHDIEPVPFSAMVGDYHDYWFLHPSIIERSVID